MCNLTDFTSKELNWLYCTLEEKMKDFQSKIESVEKFDPSELKYELYEHFNMQLNNCTQFMTKVDEAEKIVRAREILMTEN